MSVVKKVAVAGATGNVGPAIVEQLLLAGFEVTALTREGSEHKFPEKVAVARVDYSSADSLVAALRGQDAVVSTLGGPAFEAQNLLIDAAATAKVTRFIPSEFGCDTYNPKSRVLPLLNAPKAKAQEYLAAKSKTSQLTYTTICTGPFFDWCLMVGLFLDFKGREAVLCDGGDVPFSTTRLSGVGKAVVGVFRNLEATANKAVYVNEAVVTQNQLLKIAESLSGGSNWKTSVVKTEDLEKQGHEELAKSEPNFQFAAINFIKRAIWGQGLGGEFQKVDNDLLGVKLMSDAEIRDLVGKYVV